MKLVISEKQLSKLVSQLEVDQDINEQGEGEGAPETGASSDGEKKTGASKWESGATRGKANPIGLTTWESGVTRGKANPLWEQLSVYQLANTMYQNKVAADAANAKLVQILRPDGGLMYAPYGTEILSIFGPDAMDGSRFQTSLKIFISKENGGLGNSQTMAWVPKDWSKIIALNSVSQFKTPDGKVYEAIIKHPQLQKLGTTTWDEFYKLYPNPSGWKFYYYVSVDGKEMFKGVTPAKTLLHHLDEWKYWILTGASIIAAILIPGIGGLIISIGIDLFSAALQYAEGDTIGSGVSVILAFIPVIGRAIPALKVPKEVAENLAKGLAPLKTEAEIIDFVENLSKVGLEQERYFLQKLLAEDPKKLVGLIEKELLGSVTQQNAADVVVKLNQLIKNKVLDKVSAERWYKSLGLKRFGFDLGVSGLVVGAGVGLKIYLDRLNRIKSLDISPDEKDMMISQLIQDIQKEHGDGFTDKIMPVIEKYSSYDEGGEEQIQKYMDIKIAVLQAYLTNPNQDLYKVAEQANK